MLPPTRSHPYLRATAIGAVYGIAAAATVFLTRFEGGVAHLWIATALLLAELTIIPRRNWWPTLLACGVASFGATALFGIGLAGALPMALVNLSEAAIGAWLIGRLVGDEGYLESVGNVALFAIAAGAAGPAISGLAGAAVVSAVTRIPFSQNWFAWMMGHGLGTLTFAPVAALFLQGYVGAWLSRATTKMKIEAAALMLGMIATCWLVFAQGQLPLLFLPMLPLVLITFRIGRAGAAASLVVLALVGGILTARGFGPVNLIPGSVAARSEFFQFYLAVTVLIVLPLAAELKHRKFIFRQLQESEARYKLITESATDMVLTFGTDGTILYASPSTREIAGYDPETMIGRQGREFVDPNDRDAIVSVRAKALAEPGTTYSVVYRAPTAERGSRWFEARIRGITDERGRSSGLVCAIRDISDQKQLEMHLSHAASTDPLTGLANRRLFDLRLDSEIAATLTGGEGCVAVFDLDHFKRINDRYGHETGDRVLKAFAAEATRVLAGDALVARLGGEEFGVILPNTDPQHAAELCNRLRRAVASLQIEEPGGGIVGVTVSAGIADFGMGVTRPEVMRAADHALYGAKAAGRDRLRIAA